MTAGARGRRASVRSRRSKPRRWAVSKSPSNSLNENSTIARSVPCAVHAQFRVLLWPLLCQGGLFVGAGHVASAAAESDLALEGAARPRQAPSRQIRSRQRECTQSGRTAGALHSRCAARLAQTATPGRALPAQPATQGRLTGGTICLAHAAKMPLVVPPMALFVNSWSLRYRERGADAVGGPTIAGLTAGAGQDARFEGLVSRVC